MWKYEDRLTVSLIALPFILVVFIVATVLINTNRIALNDTATRDLSVGNVQETKNIYLSSSMKNIKKGKDFDFDVYLNTQGEELGAFALDLTLDKNIFTVNIENGKNGVSKGSDSKNLSVMANPNDISDGHYRFSGICVKNCAQGDAAHIATIHLKALSNFDLPQKVDWLKVKELANALGHSFDLNNYTGQIIIK